MALFADGPQPLPAATGVLAGRESNIAAELLAAPEPSRCSDDQQEGPCRQWTHSRMCHEPPCFRPSAGFLLDSRRELVNRGVQPVQQFEQIMPAPAGPGSQRELLQQSTSLRAPQA